jgi:phosphatidylglycerophosphate synthase
MVVHPSDEGPVREELSADPRLADAVTVLSADDPSPATLAESFAPGADALIVARGDRVWSTSAMRALVEPLGEGTEALTLRAGPEAPSSGLFHLRGEALKNEVWLADDAGEDEKVAFRDHRLEWAVVRNGDDVTAAETILLASLVKPTDGVISRNLNRKISTFFSRRLARYDVSPNHVTLVVFLIGIASGPLAYRGTYEGFVLGGFCYWFSAVLDGTDGELSRLKYLGSPLGAWLDTITDDAVCLSYVVGLYSALARDADWPHWRWIGIVGTAFFLATVLPRYYLMARVSGSGDYQKMAADVRPGQRGLLSRIALRLRDVVFRTDFLPFYAFVTAILGVVQAFALPFAIGAVASSVDTMKSCVKYRRSSSRPEPS